MYYFVVHIFGDLLNEDNVVLVSILCYQQPIFFFFFVDSININNNVKQIFQIWMLDIHIVLEQLNSNSLMIIIGKLLSNEIKATRQSNLLFVIQSKPK